MIRRAVIAGAALSIAFGATAGVSRRRRRLEPGMVVIDRPGAKVGTVVQTGQVRNGAPAVLLDVNGARIKVPDSKLRLTRDGEEAVISPTRSQIRTSSILNTF
ncbi:MAG TPA: hypothetical protein VFC47_09720 [Caulobacteraceae bacterium]|nr:hypothetical protein [Caulobacteraceae bacterium]